MPHHSAVGNRERGCGDPVGVNRLRDSDDLDCATAREHISADADRQLERPEVERLEAHLDGCDDCAHFADRVTTLTRSVRLRTASIDVAFVDQVMARSQPARLGRGGWMRPALAWVGLVIAAQSVAPLVFGEIDGTPTHVARHVGASTLALAIGLLYVAWRPHRAFGLLPFAAALFATMVAGAVFDTIGGNQAAMSELVHLGELVGLVLVWMIAGSPGWDRVERIGHRGRSLARP